MHPITSAELARSVIALLPEVMRQLFTMEDDPARELPLAQLQVCSLLLDAPRPMSALSRELKISLSAMTQLADRMERADLVQRVAEGTDRRVRRLRLTPRGKNILRYREEARLHQVKEVIEQLSLAERHQVLSAMKTLLTACNAKNDHPPHRQIFAQRTLKALT